MLQEIHQSSWLKSSYQPVASLLLCNPISVPIQCTVQDCTAVFLTESNRLCNMSISIFKQLLY